MRINSERMTTQSTLGNTRSNQLLTLTGLVNNSHAPFTRVVVMGNRICVEEMQYRYEYRGGAQVRARAQARDQVRVEAGQRRAQARFQVLQALRQPANQAAQAPERVEPEQAAPASAQPMSDAQNQQERR